MTVRGNRQVHQLVAKTAQEIAGAWYEQAAGKDNNFYRRYPNQKQFVNSKWGHFLGEARKILSQMLGRPDYSEETKREIYEALINSRHVEPTVHPHMRRPPSRIFVQ